jgi:hypothetical protein
MVTNPRVRPVERATGRPWDEWLRFMDSIGAQELDHQQIALKVYAELDGTVERLGWWTQAVTVAYEQHIGRRVPGQRPDGTFQTSVSRATPLGMEELMQRWQQFATHDKVVQRLVAGPVRCSGTERRITWRTKAHDGSAVVVTSEPKRGGTASIVATQMGPGDGRAERRGAPAVGGHPSPDSSTACRDPWQGPEQSGRPLCPRHKDADRTLAGVPARRAAAAAAHTSARTAMPSRRAVATVRRLERGTGVLATAAITRMEECSPVVPRDVGGEPVVGQPRRAGGIAAFVDWFRRPEGPLVIGADVFGTARGS